MTTVARTATKHFTWTVTRTGTTTVTTTVTRTVTWRPRVVVRVCARWWSECNKKELQKRCSVPLSFCLPKRKRNKIGFISFSFGQRNKKSRKFFFFLFLPGAKQLKKRMKKHFFVTATQENHLFTVNKRLFLSCSADSKGSLLFISS